MNNVNLYTDEILSFDADFFDFLDLKPKQVYNRSS